MEFHIEAVDASGKQQSLTVTASDETAALSFAKSRGLFPTDVQQKTPYDPTQRTKVKGKYGVRHLVAIIVGLPFALMFFIGEDALGLLCIAVFVAVLIGLAVGFSSLNRSIKDQIERNKLQSQRKNDSQSTTRQIQFPTIRQLAELRAEGLLSEDEFKAFYEIFTKSTGEKAQDIIEAIKDLHEQHLSGAMSKGNYDSALWGLLDKLDRKTN